MIDFIVYGEPKGKGRPRATYNGRFTRIYTPQDTTNYENLIKLSYLDAKQINYMQGEQIKAKIDIFQSIPKATSKKKTQLMLNGKIRPTKKPDIDNIIKCVFDALNGIAFKDDTQIICVESQKYYDNEPRIEICLQEIKQIE